METIFISLLKACRGIYKIDIDIILEQHDNIDINYRNGLVLREAVIHNDSTIVKKLLNYSKIHKILIKPKLLNHILSDVIVNRGIDLIDYIFKFGNDNDIEIDIYYDDFKLFKNICRFGTIDILKYVLNYCDIMNKNIDEKLINIMFINSCKNVYCMTIQYVIEYSEKINKRIDITGYLYNIISTNEHNNKYIIKYCLWLEKHNYKSPLIMPINNSYFHSFSDLENVMCTKNTNNDYYKYLQQLYNCYCKQYIYYIVNNICLNELKYIPLSINNYQLRIKIINQH